MRIGIVSDTHGSVAALRRVIRQAPPVECWFHAGDYASDANLLEQATGLKVYRVCGNCDRWHDNNAAKVDEFYELEGWSVWLTHGNRYLRNGGDHELAWWARKLDQRIVVFGHTHVPLFQKDGDVYLINPGSPYNPRGGSKAGFAVLNLRKGMEPEVEFITLEP